MIGLESGKIYLVGGKGDQKATFTHPDDVAGFVAYILTHLPASELEDKVFRIEGESATMLQIAGYYGAKYPVEYVGEIPGEPFKNALQAILNGGKGSVAYSVEAGKDLTGAEAAGASNALWVGHQWKGIKEGLGL